MNWLFDSAKLSVLEGLILAASVKGILLLIAAAALSLLLRRASAAARHFVWSLGLTGLVALPLLSFGLPVWQIAVLPSAPNRPVAAGAEAPEIAPNVPQMISSRTTAEPLSSGHEPALTNVKPISRGSETDSNARGMTSAAKSLGWVEGAFVLWLLGALLIVGRLLIGTASIWWIARRADGIDDDWLNRAGGIAAQIGLTRRVQILKTSRITMPVTCGLLSPTILLPADADAWPDERRRVVLVHELAHVKRWDCLTQLFAQLACSIYWFNPLVWLAIRQLRIERERACDDQVIDVGTKASAYAGHLLDMARTFRSTRCSSLATVAIARRSQLEGRLLAILDPGLKRRGLNRIAATAVGVVTVCIVLTLATVRLSVKAQADSLPPGESSLALVANPANQGAIPLGSLVVQSEHSRAEQPSASGEVSTPRRDEEHQDGGDQELAAQDGTAASTPARQQDNSAVIEALREAMKDEDSEVRRHALFALSQIGDQAAVAVLIEALKDRSWQIRTKAAFGLGLRGGRNGIDALVGALQDTSWQVREQSAWGLGLRGDARAIEPLINALRDESPEVREKAAWALGLKGDKRSVEALIAALKDSSTGVRGMAAWALGLKADSRAANALKDALKDSDKGVRQKAAWALGMLLMKSGGAPVGLPDPDVDNETESESDAIANGGVQGGISGGVAGGVSGGIAGGVAGGISGGVAGGISGSASGGVADAFTGRTETGAGVGTGGGVGVAGGAATRPRTQNGSRISNAKSLSKTKNKTKQK